MNDNKLIQKSGIVESQDLSDEELAKINKFSLKNLNKEEIYTFKLRICDNEIDRDFEVFPLESLDKLKDLFIGKAIIKDHSCRADNQIARIYDTELMTESGRTKTGEPYTSLIAHCYMVKTEKNKDLITEIEAGIKKEVSVGCSIGQVICSVCGIDNRVNYCPHYNGKKYDDKVCYFELKQPLDAYEVSFVAVPAQPKAGTTKNYSLGKNDNSENQEPVEENKVTENSNKKLENNENNKEDIISLKLKMIDSFIYVEERGNVK